MLFIYVFSIVVFYRYIKYFLNSRTYGKFLFKVNFDRNKRVICSITTVLYVIYIVMFCSLKFTEAGFSYVDAVLLLTWVLFTYLPDKIYENGIKTSFEFIPWHEVTLKNKISKNKLLLDISQKDLHRKKYLVVNDEQHYNRLINDFLTK